MKIYDVVTEFDTVFNVAGIDNPFFFPFRKPKRIRTAFSPSQLLKLEQIFEKNHYVVGQERKELALSLNLTETQVCTRAVVTSYRDVKS